MTTQNSSQYLRCSLTGVERRGIITSLNSQATPLLTQFLLLPRHTSDSCSAHCPPGPWSFSIELLSSQPIPSGCCCGGLLHPRCRTLRSIPRFPPAHFRSLPRSLWMAALPASKLQASHDPGMRRLRMHSVTLSGCWFGPPQIIGVGQNIPSLWQVHHLWYKSNFWKRQHYHRSINHGTKLHCVGVMLGEEKQFVKSCSISSYRAVDEMPCQTLKYHLFMP